ncbi:D-amino-acid transaminase [Azospirillum brasilense]|uniref:Probable branched-chain-amino-acid aminotransferase n=1 Tax=Azospirillum brasilense TaxID=192 RepID=A0A0P0FAX3_AZOBR|nr:MULTISPECIES: D-amino-acid transaminase [Azospirillum]ALJ37288.1 D-amino acid aminotransferase [Azospirillum brasilense]MDW7552013.1 D-amino-acid transaminase [Azospirillum brasilense]MDW7591448.1 D-amino-acid transaminase [Azospirillum brasilense]MDW7626618.1 D-amino-acid transaminase [Azospirillum brasilense]MDX5951033.1 D-amino-acid transaminase [Azospirillum brasilense]
MARWAYVNGRYLPHRQAAVHVEDRGFQFADGVYEVVTLLDGRFADMDGHMERLGRSLSELRMDWPAAPRVVTMIARELVRRNGVRNGSLYIQVTRGVAPRDFKFPADTPATLVMTVKRVTAFAKPEQLEKGVAVVTVPDIRWGRRDIKTVGLLAPVLAKQQAAESGAYEAWLIDPDGTVTEGSSSNAWIVTQDGVLVTRPPSQKILNGITRLSLLRLAGERGIPVEERSFTVEEALAAREAFVSSAGTFALPVTRIDGKPVGEGRPGPVTRALRQAYLDYVAAELPS